MSKEGSCHMGAKDGIFVRDSSRIFCAIRQLSSADLSSMTPVRRLKNRPAGVVAYWNQSLREVSRSEPRLLVVGEVTRRGACHRSRANLSGRPSRAQQERTRL
ncbi:hypothetical protein Nepgr_010256 [Nepenthes gracilis]|uniref:Uncharacterized protein n=1 Tax=Nepenthes gracilis TaxID=150966 RepID=A0AAD3XL75_NEPGR|nr:hypothetical protein Nepgr_010256 [Nepenthes gracilis]